jgi:hypothetical protein
MAPLVVSNPRCYRQREPSCFRANEFFWQWLDARARVSYPESLQEYFRYPTPQHEVLAKFDAAVTFGVCSTDINELPNCDASTSSMTSDSFYDFLAHLLGRHGLLFLLRCFVHTSPTIPTDPLNIPADNEDRTSLESTTGGSLSRPDSLMSLIVRRYWAYPKCGITFAFVLLSMPFFAESHFKRVPPQYHFKWLLRAGPGSRCHRCTSQMMSNWHYLTRRVVAENRECMAASRSTATRSRWNGKRNLPPGPCSLLRRVRQISDYCSICLTHYTSGA